MPDPLILVFIVVVMLGLLGVGALLRRRTGLSWPLILLVVLIPLLSRPVAFFAARALPVPVPAVIVNAIQVFLVVLFVTWLLLRLAPPPQHTASQPPHAEEPTREC
jgi:hypothetical protein